MYHYRPFFAYHCRPLNVSIFLLSVWFYISLYFLARLDFGCFEFGVWNCSVWMLGLWILYCWMLGFGIWIFWFCDFGFCNFGFCFFLDFVFLLLEFGIWILSLEFWILDYGLWPSGSVEKWFLRWLSLFCSKFLVEEMQCSQWFLRSQTAKNFSNRNWKANTNSNSKIQNQNTQNPESRKHKITSWKNIGNLEGSEMVYPTLPRKKQQKPISENNVDPLAPFPNKKKQNPTTQDPNSKFHIEQIQNPNPQNIQKIYILRGSEMVYPTLPRKKQQEPIRENNVDPLAPFPNKKIQNPTTQDPNSKFHIEQIYIYIYIS